MKYGVGQQVIVKDFNELSEKYDVSNGGIVIGDYFFEREMKVYCGEKYRIINCFDGLYELNTGDNEGWLFHEEVLELPNEKKEEKVRVIFETVDYCAGDLENALKEIDMLKKENEELRSQLKAKNEHITDGIKDDIIVDTKPAKRPYKRKNAVL